jgi:hypothetical protein
MNTDILPPRTPGVLDYNLWVKTYTPFLLQMIAIIEHSQGIEVPFDTFARFVYGKSSKVISPNV